MKKQDLKSILRPLIKEILKEEILGEKGVLAHIMSETLKANQPVQQIRESRQATIEETTKEFISSVKPPQDEFKKKELEEQRQKLIEGIGKSGYGKLLGGIPAEMLFEGTKPLSGARSTPVSNGSAPKTILSDVAPDDPGIDISSFFNPAWKQLAAGNTKKEN